MLLLPCFHGSRACVAQVKERLLEPWKRSKKKRKSAHPELQQELLGLMLSYKVDALQDSVGA